MRYDILHALLVLSWFGRLSDPRCADALEIVASKRGRDGLWRANGRWWRQPGATG